ncbi:MAG: SDR family NAD(P)-dependent oxidoreductase [Desulfitobacteriaceae bacterium]
MPTTLINNAGITRDGFLAKTSPEQGEQVIAVNLTGVLTARKQLPRFEISKNGRG